MNILIPVALGAVLIVLVAGVISMSRGGSFNARYGNRLMRLRVALQFVAIILIAIAALALGD